MHPWPELPERGTAHGSSATRWAARFQQKAPPLSSTCTYQGSTEINNLPPGSSETKGEALGKRLASRRGFPIRPKALLGPGRGLSAALSRPETGGEALEGQPEVTMGRDPLSPGQQPAHTLVFYLYFIWEENLRAQPELLV